MVVAAISLALPYRSSTARSESQAVVTVKYKPQKDGEREWLMSKLDSGEWGIISLGGVKG